MPATSEWLYRRIVEESPIAILYADHEGIIRMWNAGAEAMFGHTAVEALGRSMDMIIPEKHRPRHWEGWNKVMQSGVTKYGHDVLAVPALRKDGSRISIEFNVVLMKDEAGKVVGAAAMINDVTARWEREKATKARIAELEKRLAEHEKVAAHSSGS
jgi:PAS domain S-box-containing protein